MYSCEQKRTFALIPVEHSVKHLDASQFQSYQRRLSDITDIIQDRFNLTQDELYEFLYKLLELQSDYQNNERHKLSDEIKNDILYLAHFIEISFAQNWDEVADELGQRYTIWVKRQFRHLITLNKEIDEALEILTHTVENYHKEANKLNIPNPSHVFPSSDADNLLEYCKQEGLFVFISALSGMIATQEVYSLKFRRVNQYSNLKNILTSLEFLLKHFAQNANITLRRQTLNPIIQQLMGGEPWISIFIAKTQSGLTSANTSTEFYNKLNLLIQDSDLVQSEDVFWAREFLIASLARNLTVHLYPDFDWFFGDLFGEMLRAGICSIIYSWEVANREGWV